MPTQKECHICKEKIGVASKTCQHCGAKQPYKQKLEKRKKKVALDWKERQKKNCSVNKVYDATNLLLHKWEVLERHPILLLARRTTNGFLAECFCPWQKDTEDAKDDLVKIKKIYESLLYAVEPLLTNSTMTREEVLKNHESSTPAEPQTNTDTENDDGNCYRAQTDFNISRIKEEQEELGDNSQTHTENDNGNYCLLQRDLNISGIKEEQEDLGDDSQTQQVIFTSSEVVKSEQDELETQVTYEMQPVSSDCSEDQSGETDSDEEWVQSKGTLTKKKKKRKVKVLQRQNGGMDQTSPDGDPPTKTPKGRSLCPVCGKGFQYTRPLMKHINTHNTNESAKELLSDLQSARNQRLICEVCGKTFTSSSCLQMHTKIHAGIKDFKCQDCGKTFVRKEHLVVHVRTHSGVRPYHCDICGKGFSQSQNLRVHRRSHTGERPYRCSSCGKLFHTSGHLKTHMKRFSGEKPYTCEICDQFFCQRELLTQHKNTHTAE